MNLRLALFELAEPFQLNAQASRKLRQPAALHRIHERHPGSLLHAFVIMALALGLFVLNSMGHAFNHALKIPVIVVAREKLPSTRVVTPIFSQLLMYSNPDGFKPVFEHSNEHLYIHESVPPGESLENWSQMISATGVKGLASHSAITPESVAGRLAGGFSNLCPATFSGAIFGASKLGEHDAFTVVVECGTTNEADVPRSESTLLIVIKGASDYYTLQWTERGAASTSPINYDAMKWQARLRSLAPVKLCEILPGESAPYSSCAGRHF